MAPDSPGIVVERIDIENADGQLALVTLNRPAEMNPLDWDTSRELAATFDELGHDGAVRVVAVTGAGSAFSAGGDMKKYQVLQRDLEQFPRFLEDFHELATRMSAYPKPYVALVNGIAVAGGLELMLSCDLAIAAESAKIGDAHLPFGQMGGGGVLTLLPRAVGLARARELVFTGRLLGAREACAWGLVSEVVADDELLSAGMAFASSVAKKSQLAVANAKRVMNAGYWEGTGVTAGLRLEREVTTHYCTTSEDAQEGLHAFADKRRPAFRGR